MRQFESRKFLELMEERTKGRGIPSCPFCGGQKFSSPSKVAQMIIGDDLDALSIGPSVPAGMVICSNCGHIDFFAIGVLGMLTADGKGGEIHDEQK